MVRLSEMPAGVRERMRAQMARTRARRGEGNAECGMRNAEGGGVNSRRVKRGIKRSRALAEEFKERCRRRGMAVPVTEHYFVEGRQWRFDLAWPERMVAIEIDGGAFMKGGGGHNRGAGMRKDQEKLNEAAARGWRVLRFFPERVLGEAAFGLAGRALGTNR